jgi:chitodextrinase
MSTSTARFLLASSLIVLLPACQDATAPETATNIAPAFARGGFRDNSSPSTPGNLRITGNTTFTVSLAWDASTSKSSSLSYRINNSRGFEQGSMMNQTTYTWPNLDPGTTYSFWVYALDAAGNRSGNSNTVTITLPRDTQAPTTPVLSLLNVGPTHASVGWSSTDDGWFIVYDVFRDGVAVASSTSATSATFSGLQPATTYTFTAVARDKGPNSSPASAPLTVTTPAADAQDVTPPSAPTNVSVDLSYSSSSEVMVRWTQSNDNRDPQSMIRYEVYVNGKHENSVSGKGEINAYLDPGDNKVEVFAIDTSGNRSAAGVVNVFNPF